MNKNRYRIIFNRERGMLMVVPEIARTKGGTVTAKAVSLTSGLITSLVATLKPLSLLTALSLGATLWVTPADAKIVADASAPGHQQPQIIESSNGTPQINIQTPSKGGVSHNKYTQFDIDKQGVILNNSRQNVNTQLGGFVAGNINLAGGEAKIILNEINAKHPSQLNGFIEVAGKKAEVVIANAAGITCDGCGFINASRSTLTTGKPIINQGQLQGFDVQTGLIRITGQGLDTSRQDYTHLIARSVVVNAGLWANDLNVMTGRNTVSADGQQVTAHTAKAEEAAPKLAVDVSHLGGMYAGKIRLVGTEKGVGVHNAGKLGAQAGSVLINADGKIENSGVIHAATTLSMTSQQQLNNQGTLYGNQQTKIQARSLLNRGELASKSDALQLNIHGTVDNQGQLHAATDIHLTSQSDLTNSGTLYAGRQLSINTKTLTNHKDIAAKDNLTIKTQWLNSQAGSTLVAGIDKQQQLQKTGQLTLDAKQTNIAGKVIAADKLVLNSDTTDISQSGEVLANQSTITAHQTLTNRGVIDGSHVHLEAQTLDNLGTGRLYGDTLTIQSVTLNNLAEDTISGTIAARIAMKLGVGTLNNRDHALIYSGGSLQIGRTLDAQHQLSGRAETINNHSATIEADGDMQITVGRLNNINDHFITAIQEVYREKHHEYRLAGSLNRWDASEVGFSHHEVLHLHTPDRLWGDEFYEYQFERVIQESVITETDPAKLLAGGQLTIDADHVLNDKSQIAAGGDLNLQANTLDNIEVAGERFITDTGTVAHWWRIHKKGSDDQGHSVTHYRPATVIQQITLQPSTVESHTPIEGSGTEVVRTDNQVNIKLPTSSLYHINPKADGQYLIETDARFTQYKKWLSSDYMIAQMKAAPNNVMKRLGDGYYEQKLIREQIIGITGERYLPGYRNDEAQYKALMSAGVEFAQQYGLSIGVALTQAQMAQLTSDIVWLVAKTVTLPDGSQQTVLAPQVYTRTHSAQIQGNGALISGQQVGLQLTGDIQNSGHLQGRDSLTIDAKDIHNLGGRLQGDTVNLNASHDIHNQGGHIQAKDHLQLTAGNDIHITSTVSQQTNGPSSNTSLSSVGSLVVTGDKGQLQLSAGNDIELQAANIANQGEQGNTSLQAGNDIRLTTVTTGQQESIVFDADNHSQLSVSEDIGTVISGKGNLSLSANNDLHLTAANLDAGEQLSLTAGKDLTIESGHSTASLEEHSKSSGKGGSGLSSITKERHTSHQENNRVGSQLGGNEIQLNAGQNITISGSQVIADQDLTAKAGKDLTIESAAESYHSQTETKTTKKGLMSSGGLGFTVGKKQEKLAQTDSTTEYQGSTLGSLNGNIHLEAGQDLTLKGSDLIGKQDIALTGNNIHLLADDNTSRYHEKYEMTQSGLTVAVTGTASDIYQAGQTLKAAKENQNDRLGALQGLKGSLSLVEAYQDTQLNQANGSPQASMGLSASVGSSRTERDITETHHSVQGSSLHAGNNLTLTATGDKQGQGGDITLKGSEIHADNQLTLNANQNLHVLGAVNTQHRDMTETSESQSIGIGLSVGGDQSGLRVTGSGSFSKEREHANGSAWTESLITAGDKLSITTGKDTHLMGGQLKGEQITAEIGGNLHIQSLQDTDNYDYEKLSGAIDGSIGAGGSLNVDLSQTQMNSQWASVTDQSGIFAGNEGFDITVGNQTDLIGGVIASTAKDKTKNSLDTGTLNFKDIDNKADYQVDHNSLSAGTSGANPQANYHKKDSADSTTHSAVEEGNLIVRNQAEQTQNLDELSRDTANANNPLGHLFDKQKAQDTIDTLQQINDIGKQVTDILNNHSKLQAQKEAAAKANDPAYLAQIEQALKTKNPNASAEEIKQAAYEKAYNQSLSQSSTAMGGDLKQGIDSAVSIITGLVSGNITGGLAGAAAPHIAEQLKALEKDNPEAHKIAHGILGGIVAQLQGNSALAGATGAAASELAADIIKESLYGKDIKNEELSPEQKDKIAGLASLVGGLAGALTGEGSTIADAATGTSAGKNAVENNALVVPILPPPAIVPNPLKEEADKTLAQALDNVLDSMGKTLTELTSSEKEQVLQEALKSLDPAEQKQIEEQIGLALSKPQVKDMQEYMSNNDYGQLLKAHSELAGYDAQGNPIYKAIGGAGNFINGEDQFSLSGNKDAILVYNKAGQFISALNLDGTQNKTLTEIYQGGVINSIVEGKRPTHTGHGGGMENIEVPTHTGNTDGSDKLDMPIHTGHTDSSDKLEMPTHTGNTEGTDKLDVPTHTGGDQILDGDLNSNIMISESKSNGLNFGNTEKLDSHFSKHGAEMKQALNKKNYTISDYLNDANHVIKEGQFVPEMNGYIKFIGGEGSAKYAFVGVDRKTGNITTLHLKSVKELAKKAPSLGLKP